ncbi:RRM/R3H domain-containing protein [Flagelloscypha sp. PMI_526]|nr:RRM/R3H domain-containing protein [Flagelloscypha sp. PMI_526]
MTSTPPIDNLQGLTLNDTYEYDTNRPAYHYATSTGIPAHQQFAQPAAQLPTQTQSPLKGKPARGGLPSQWLENQDGRSISPQNNSDFSSAGGSPPPQGGVPPANPDDDIIPTAIVIKNIPFNVKRETLLDIIASLSIPTPYAFNYHLDQQGAFRGLAFANFRQSVDADAVVAALNGFDVQGRKLRVEYKKVLQAGEKERIEREKAIRRMRSMQLEKEGTGSPGIYDPYGSPVPPSAFPPPPQRSFSTSSYTQDQVSYSPPSAQQIQSPVSYSHALSSAAPPQAPATPSASEKALAPELDLNDPSTLEIYSRILLFKDDRMRDELAFSRNLSPKQRRVVHLIAQKLGVFHYSMGEGDERYAVVTRIDPNRQQQRPAHTLSRAPSAYLAQSPTASSPTAASLRSKKSMPDMKTLHQQAPRLTPRASNGNIREGYATIGTSPRRMSSGYASLFSAGQNSGFGSPGSSVPPIPGLPSSSLGGLGGPLNGNHDVAGVVRQPRGPGTGGFTRRDSRVGLSESAAPARAGLEARTYEPLEI